MERPLEGLEGGLGLLVLLDGGERQVHDVDDLGVQDLGLAEQALEEGALLDGADHAGDVGRVLAVDDRELADRVGVEAVDAPP